MTGIILKRVLQHLDTLEPFDDYRKQCRTHLFADGHDSRFHIDFLEYINSEDHKRTVYIGVP